MQVRLNLDRDEFLALYLVRRANVWVSLPQKIHFPYTADTFWGSFRYRTYVWFWFADPQFVVQKQPWLGGSIAVNPWPLTRLFWAEKLGSWDFRRSPSFLSSVEACS